ncbi:putative C6 transcription factor [Aspergillus saccharolyticus JOP 1030-1]|uniref:C6 transcription factor n=1 Tax=Aspergillus saccharolyticus JOP 1030-1 TaxID=1450539 RepID=A0A318YZY1_9EURO|nr:C6 transcription factor [Aspergillus saccharolyticus JOP 1030-1]PYH40276.1 C6 transcription factor [Aspergillus saccharolyticus JOP 1030-1]
MADVQLKLGASAPISQAEQQHQQPQQHQHRVRKRRRRTMACMQCRSRKLRCDREYPVCGRCQKSKTPTRCTYEDGFLWQQPNTVASPVFSEKGPTATTQMAPTDRATAHPTPDSGISSLPTRPQPISRDSRPGEERRDKFLETVLGAPKAAVNQEPYANTSLLQRPRQVLELHQETQPHHPGEDEEDLASPTQQLDISPRIMMRGRETKTRYNGSGIFANLIAQFPDLRAFAEEIRVASPHLSALRPDLIRVKKGLWKRKPLNEPFPMPTMQSLITMLPSRPVVDELVYLYCSYIESSHRILHMPSFVEELEQFWTQRDSPDMTSPIFVVQLLLVLACAWNLADLSALQMKNEANLSCYTAIEWILHAEKWMENANFKRPELATLRLETLLITAQNIHGMKRSQAWLATGTLVKRAMMAGYHRDPSRYTKISAFSMEMRRRMWATIVELDLQISLERGMPPSVQEDDYDTFPALNIDDADIHEDSTELPKEKPLEVLTDSSFQAVLSQSLPLRLKACALMHSPRISCRYEEIIRLDWELNRHLSRIPTWPTPEMDDFHRTSDRVVLIKALLTNKIGHSLLSIHTPFAIEAPKEALFAPSARSRLEVASMILSTQRRLREMSTPLSLCNMGEWTVQAYCTICQLLHEKDGTAGELFSDLTYLCNMLIESLGGFSTSLTRTLPGLPEFLISLVETTLTCLESRLLLVVKGAKEYFFMSTILALVKASLWPSQSHIYKQEVVERVILFAQTLFTRHANCAHLGDWGMGSFKTNQVGVSVIF